MLDELKTAHEEMLAALAELEALTAKAACDEPAVATARIRLSRASRQRRILATQAIDRLFSDASAADAARLKGLRERNSEQLEASAKHIGTWGLRTIRENWPQYCRASQDVRRGLRELIATDREVLYPLLSREG